MKYTDPSQEMIGNTPLVYWGEYRNATIWVKDEGRNLTGAIKDRTAKAIVADLKKQGKLTPDKILLDASSGSYACALSQQGKIHGIPVTVVVNKKISATNVAFLEEIGVNVIRFGNVTGDGYRRCVELVKEDPDTYLFTDQLNNPVAVQAHYEGTAPEIIADMPDVSAIVVSIGSGATALGIGRYLRDKGHAVQLFGSVGKEGDVGKLAGTYREDNDYRSPFIQELVADNYIVQIPVDYREAMHAVWKHFVPRGVNVGPQGGGVFLAACTAIDEYDISGNVVLVAGDSILKNMDRYAAH